MKMACNDHKGNAFHFTAKGEQYYIPGEGYSQAAIRQLPAFARAHTLASLVTLVLHNLMVCLF